MEKNNWKVGSAVQTREQIIVLNKVNGLGFTERKKKLKEAKQPRVTWDSSGSRLRGQAEQKPSGGSELS